MTKVFHSSDVLAPQGEGNYSFLISQLTYDYLGCDISEEACQAEEGEKKIRGWGD